MMSQDDLMTSGINGRLRSRKVSRDLPFPGPKKDKKNELNLNQEPDHGTALHFCLYCDKTFNTKLTLSKHINRVHVKGSIQHSSIECLFCKHNDTPTNVLKHMVENHPNHYYACLDCQERFLSSAELAKHKHIICDKVNEEDQTVYKNKLRSRCNPISTITNRSVESNIHVAFPISCELKPTKDEDPDIENNITANVIIPSYKSMIQHTDVHNIGFVKEKNKNPASNFTFNTSTETGQFLSRLGVVHRLQNNETIKYKEIKYKEDDAKFEKCFNKTFYSKVGINIQENLTKFLDGSLDQRKLNLDNVFIKKKNKRLTLNTYEGFPVLLAPEQCLRNIIISNFSRLTIPKHKSKWGYNEIEKVTSDQPLYRDLHADNCIVSAISKLDIWTQKLMRQRFEKLLKSTTEKDSQNCTTKNEINFTSDGQINDFPSYLGLKPSTAIQKLTPATLSGEWARPRKYVCCACGELFEDSKSLTSHMTGEHPNCQIDYCEIVGEHLQYENVFKDLYESSQPSNRSRPLRGSRECTKCKKPISFDDLHEHILECAGDTPVIRRKCRNRPFGVRRRRTRLADNKIRKKKGYIRKDIGNLQNLKKKRLKPKAKRADVGDGETIRKMLADLPAKRHRMPMTSFNINKNKEMPRSKLRHRQSNSDNKPIKLFKDVNNGDTPKNHTVDKAFKTPKSIRNKSEKSSVRRNPVRQSALLKKEDDKEIPHNNISASDNKERYTLSSFSTPNEVDRSNTQGKSNDQLSMGNYPSKLSFNGSFNSKDNSSQEGSNNRNSRRQRSNDPNGSGSKNNVPHKVPLKHSIEKITENMHSSHSNSFDHSKLMEQPYITNYTQSTHLMSIVQKPLFEQETVVIKLDKPPLPNPPEDFGVFHKSKHNKPRLVKKGLNDCIAMLKNKLVEPNECSTDDLPLIQHKSRSPSHTENTNVTHYEDLKPALTDGRMILPAHINQTNNYRVPLDLSGKSLNADKNLATNLCIKEINNTGLQKEIEENMPVSENYDKTIPIDLSLKPVSDNETLDLTVIRSSTDVQIKENAAKDTSETKASDDPVNTKDKSENCLGKISEHPLLKSIRTPKDLVQAIFSYDPVTNTIQDGTQKVGLLQREIVDILGTMPLEKRNTLLDALPEVLTQTVKQLKIAVDTSSDDLTSINKNEIATQTLNNSEIIQREFLNIDSNRILMESARCALEPLTARSALETPSARSALEPSLARSALEPQSARSALEPPLARSALEPPSARSALEPQLARSALEPPLATSALEPPSARSALEQPSLRSALEPPSARSALEPPLARSALEPPPVRSALEPPSARSPLEPAPTRSALEPPLARFALEPPSARSALEPTSAQSALEPQTARSALEPPPTRSALEPTSVRSALEPPLARSALEPAFENPKPVVESIKLTKDGKVIDLTFEESVKLRNSNIERKPVIIDPQSFRKHKSNEQTASLRAVRIKSSSDKSKKAKYFAKLLSDSNIPQTESLYELPRNLLDNNLSTLANNQFIIQHTDVHSTQHANSVKTVITQPTLQLEDKCYNSEQNLPNMSTQNKTTKIISNELLTPNITQNMDCMLPTPQYKANDFNSTAYNNRYSNTDILVNDEKCNDITVDVNNTSADTGLGSMSSEKIEDIPLQCSTPKCKTDAEKITPEAEKSFDDDDSEDDISLAIIVKQRQLKENSVIINNDINDSAFEETNIRQGNKEVKSKKSKKNTNNKKSKELKHSINDILRKDTKSTPKKDLGRNVGEYVYESVIRETRPEISDSLHENDLTTKTQKKHSINESRLNKKDSAYFNHKNKSVGLHNDSNENNVPTKVVELNTDNLIEHDNETGTLEEGDVFRPDFSEISSTSIEFHVLTSDELDPKNSDNKKRKSKKTSKNSFKNIENDLQKSIQLEGEKSNSTKDTTIGENKCSVDSFAEKDNKIVDNLKSEPIKAVVNVPENKPMAKKQLIFSKMLLDEKCLKDLQENKNTNNEVKSKVETPKLNENELEKTKQLASVVNPPAEAKSVQIDTEDGEKSDPNKARKGISISKLKAHNPVRITDFICDDLDADSNNKDTTSNEAYINKTMKSIEKKKRNKKKLLDTKTCILKSQRRILRSNEKVSKLEPKIKKEIDLEENQLLPTEIEHKNGTAADECKTNKKAKKSPTDKYEIDDSGNEDDDSFIKEKKKKKATKQRSTPRLKPKALDVEQKTAGSKNSADKSNDIYLYSQPSTSGSQTHASNNDESTVAHLSVKRTARQYENDYDSDDSLSDTPLHKYVGDSAKHVKNQNDSGINISVNEQIPNKKDKDKNRRCTKGSIKSENGELTEEQKSEQFMESFGFFSKRKPRKSNLIAAKKIAETFHRANESDEVYFSKKRNSVKPPKTKEQKIKKLLSIMNDDDRDGNTSSEPSAKRSKRRRRRKNIRSYCSTCQLQFRRPDNLCRHTLSFSHASKICETDFQLKLETESDTLNLLIPFRKRLDKLKKMTLLNEELKAEGKEIVKLPTLNEVVTEMLNQKESQIVSRRGLSRDEALFIDCCEMLKESHKSEKSETTTIVAITEPYFNVSVAEPISGQVDTYQTVKNVSIPESISGSVDTYETVNNISIVEPISGPIETYQNVNNVSIAESITGELDTYQAINNVSIAEPISGQVDTYQTDNNVSMAEPISEQVDTYQTVNNDSIDEPISDQIDTYQADNKSDCDMDSVTARTIMESEEVRNLENDLIIGFKEAALKKSCDQYSSSNLLDHEEYNITSEDIIIKVEPLESPYNNDHRSEKERFDNKRIMDQVEPIEIFEDKFDKIKRKSRSTAAAKLVQPVVEESVKSTKKRKKSTKTSKVKKRSKKSKPSAVPTKGALKGFDGVKVTLSNTSGSSEIKSAKKERSSSRKKKKKSSSKKKKSNAKHLSYLPKPTAEEPKKEPKSETKDKEIDVYEFMDEDTDMLQFRRTKRQERYKSVVIDTPSTSKVNHVFVKVPSISSGSDVDDFVYMSDYVCGDDETEYSLTSTDAVKGKKRRKSRKSSSKSKHKQSSGKRAAVGKIFKNNAVHKKSKRTSGSRESVPVKSNLDQLFDSLLNNESVSFESQGEVKIPEIKEEPLSPPPAVEEEETGVARQRARRKCTVGKQNVLAETWSSESETDAPSGVDTAGAGGRRRKTRRNNPAPPARRTRRATKEETESVEVSLAETAPTDAKVTEVPPPPPPPNSVEQHGWIVGDSHKKLVTMLAHAKGRKRSSNRQSPVDETDVKLGTESNDSTEVKTN